MKLHTYLSMLVSMGTHLNADPAPTHKPLAPLILYSAKYREKYGTETGSKPARPSENSPTKSAKANVPDVEWTLNKTPYTTKESTQQGQSFPLCYPA